MAAAVRATPERPGKLWQAAEDVIMIASARRAASGPSWWRMVAMGSGRGVVRDREREKERERGRGYSPAGGHPHRCLVLGPREDQPMGPRCLLAVCPSTTLGTGGRAAELRGWELPELAVWTGARGEGAYR